MSVVLSESAARIFNERLNQVLQGWDKPMNEFMFKVGDRVRRRGCGNGKNVPVGILGVVREEAGGWYCINWRVTPGKIFKDGPNDPIYLELVEDEKMATTKMVPGGYLEINFGSGSIGNSPVPQSTTARLNDVEAQGFVPVQMDQYGKVVVSQDPYQKNCQQCANLKETNHMQYVESQRLRDELQWHQNELRRYNPKLVAAHEAGIKREMDAKRKL